MTIVQEWLKTLPEPYRTAAISQARNKNWSCDSLKDALSVMVQWHQTTEGFDFWDDVYGAVFRGTPLPPYPHSIEDLCNVLDIIKTST